MDPEDPDILLAATGHNVPEAALSHYSKTSSSPIGVYRTTDGGESWSRVIAPLPGVGGEIFTSVEYCPSDNQIVYVGSNAAVYRSSDRGVSWDIVTGETPGWGPPGGLGGIPIDPRIREGGDNGKPIVNEIPDCEESLKIIEICRQMAAQISINNSKQDQSELEIVL